MAPPFGLMRASRSCRPKARVQAKTCAANASLISMRSIWSKVRPARSNAFWLAGTGPMPMMRGSTPATAAEMILAIGWSLCARTPSSLANNNAAAPSLSPEALPAVTLPSFLKAGRKLESVSKVVLARENSSLSNTNASPLFWGMEIGKISSA